MKIYKFYTQTCVPCKQITPVLEAILQEHPEIELVTVDCGDDANAALVNQHHIRSVPTLVFEKDGSVVNSLTGYMSKTQITEAINGCLAG